MLEITNSGKKGLIIFVHGLLSDKEAFLNHQGKYFIEYLNCNKWIKDNYDYGYYIYNSAFLEPNPLKKIMRFIYPQSKPIKRNLNIQEIGEQLSKDISVYCNSYDELLLVGHSMGGLIAKSFIINCQKNIREKILCFISLATPHAGIPSKYIQTLTSIFSNPQFGDLSTFGIFLNNINTQWAEKRHEVNYSFFYGIHDSHVPPKYAVPVSEANHCIPTETDHFSIARPESAESEIVLTVAEKIKD